MNQLRTGGVSDTQRGMESALRAGLTTEPPIAPQSPAAPPFDGDLIRRLRADDLDAFHELFDRYRAAIYRTAYGLTGDPQAAEEILQDTFARAYARRAALRDDMSPLPWLHRVAVNLCFSRRRHKQPATTGDEQVVHIEAPDVQPDALSEQKELRQIVRDGVAALPPKHQSVVVLYYLHGMSLQETASFLDIRLGTVKSRLHYALRGLRTHLERDRRFEGAYGPGTGSPDARVAVERAEAAS